MRAGGGGRDCPGEKSGAGLAGGGETGGGTGRGGGGTVGVVVVRFRVEGGRGTVVRRRWGGARIMLGVCGEVRGAVGMGAE